MSELTKPPSPLLRNIAVGATAYLAGVQVLYFATRGSFPTPDSWADVYLMFIAAYAAAPEFKHWAMGTEAADNWEARLQKGGPFITTWTLILFAVALTRHADPTYPMPPELKEIVVKVVGLFLGTYAFRQIRRAKPLNGRSDSSASDLAPQILSVLEKGPLSTRQLSETLHITSRSVQREIKILVDEGKILRDAKSTNDPTATYRLK